MVNCGRLSRPKTRLPVCSACRFTEAFIESSEAQRGFEMLLSSLRNRIVSAVHESIDFKTWHPFMVIHGSSCMAHHVRLGACRAIVTSSRHVVLGQRIA